MNKAKIQLIELEAMQAAAECLKTIAHPVRLRMIEMLLHREWTVGELADACGVQSHVASEHLGRMKDRGLLANRRDGRRIFYCIEEAGLEGIMQCIRKRFGKGGTPIPEPEVTRQKSNHDGKEQSDG